MQLPADFLLSYLDASLEGPGLLYHPSLRVVPDIAAWTAGWDRRDKMALPRAEHQSPSKMVSTGT